MKVKDLYKLLLFVPVMTGCQSEEAVIADEIETPSHKYTVRASLPVDTESRTYITYGNKEPERELFRWQKPGTAESDDYITIFNVSKLSEYEKIELNVISTDDNTAEFETLTSVDEDVFQIQTGDILFVTYWAADKVENSDGNKVIMMETDQKPQPIFENPYAENYMSYMQASLKMYDIVKAEQSGQIPDIHFKHLTGIMRITLRNETGEDLWPKLLEFESPGNTPFLNSSLYCELKEAEDGGSLSVYKDSKYSDLVQFATNNYTAADTETGGAIAPGESYDLYVPFIPRDGNEADKLIIRLEGRESSSNSTSYEITINPFGVSLEAGMRYWFNLTAVNDSGERKLMFTKQWQDQQEGKNPGTGDETPSED